MPTKSLRLPIRSYSSRGEVAASGGRKAFAAGAANDDSAPLALPRHAHVVDVPGSGGKRLTILPVMQGRQRGPGGAFEVAEAIRASAPRQVLVELCTLRYADVLACALLALPTRPPPRVDILSNVYGGLLTNEFVPVLQAARDVGAAVVPVDRSHRATRSRVAQHLWHPRLVSGLLGYGASSLRWRLAAVPLDDAEMMRDELSRLCPAAYSILIEERCNFMAHQACAVATPGAHTVVVCGALHCAALARLLQAGVAADVDLAQLAKRSVPVWPLYMLAYVVIPGGFALYAAGHAWASFVVPLFAEAE